MTKENETPSTLSFGEHLDVLRKHLIRSILAILGFSIIAFFFKDIIFDVILFGPKDPNFITNRGFCHIGALLNSDVWCINKESFHLQNLELYGQFKTHIVTSILTGIIISFPYFMWELWQFIKPGLVKKEIESSRGIIFYTSLMFFIGICFGYFLIMPLALNFLKTYVTSTEIVNGFTLKSYTGMLTTITLAAGLIFELPILIYLLSKLGIVNPKMLKQYRKISITGIFILSAILTPPDVFSQLLIALPLILLYEISIRISKRVVSKKEKEAS